MTGLTPGTTYEFKIESRNEYGYSQFSDVLTLLAAYIPAVPEDIETTIDANKVLVQWALATDYGSPVTSFKVYVLNNAQDQWIQESVDCDGTSQTVIDNLSCFIYLDTLITAPYNLVLAESVQVKVIAENFYGQSDYSDPGNGAQV